MHNKKAQGALEYLLIIGVAILIVAVVVILISGALGGGKGSITDANKELQNTYGALRTNNNINTTPGPANANQNHYILFTPTDAVDTVVGKIDTIINNPGQITAPYSVSLWIKPRMLTAQHTAAIIGNEGQTVGFQLSIDNKNSRLNAIIGDDSTALNACTFTANTQIAGGITNDSWYYIVYIVNPTGYKTYLNGTEIANANYTCPLPVLVNTTAIPTTIPTIGWDSEKTPFSGGIDEIRIYNREINQSEISELFNAGRTQNNSIVSGGLIVYYPFETFGDALAPTGDSVDDLSGHSNNAIVQTSDKMDYVSE